MIQARKDPKPKKAMFMGVGLDNEDGEARLSRGKNFVLAGGSAETHAVMQETAIKINESIDHKGKTLEEVSPEEFRDIVQDVSDRLGRKDSQNE